MQKSNIYGGLGNFSNTFDPTTASTFRPQSSASPTPPEDWRIIYYPAFNPVMPFPDYPPYPPYPPYPTQPPCFGAQRCINAYPVLVR